MKRSLTDLREEMRAVARGERKASPIPRREYRQRISIQGIPIIVLDNGDLLVSHYDVRHFKNLTNCLLYLRGGSGPAWLDGPVTHTEDDGGNWRISPSLQTPPA